MSTNFPETSSPVLAFPPEQSPTHRKYLLFFLGLDTLFFEAGKTLTQEDIFSRESFQTFSEAYDIARETIERKKREQKGTIQT